MTSSGRTASVETTVRDRLAVLGGDLGARGDHGQPGAHGDRVDVQHRDQAVARVDRTVVREALVGVHDAAEVDARSGVLEQLRLGPLGHDDGERRRRDDVGIPERARHRRIRVGRVGGADRVGELLELLAAYLVGSGRRVLTTRVTDVDRHAVRGQRVSRCRV